MEKTIIRDAVTEDIEQLINIYAYYVRNTAVTFDYEIPSFEVFEEHMMKIMEKYPWLVLEKEGKILGYAYAGPFVGRGAYQWSAEVSIYLDPVYLHQGLGRQLYLALEDALKEMGVLNLYACIGYPEEEDIYLTKNSAEFHQHLGFRRVGEFYRCGYKFKKWYNMIWMEKIIGPHDDRPIPVISHR
ncbi:MAG: N-acetyltransferase [Solobacterium sp.]|nr:N-acetyltransferase [Solobacterium sp.]